MKKHNNNIKIDIMKNERTDVRDFAINGYNNLSPFQRPLLPTSYYPFSNCRKNKKR